MAVPITFNGVSTDDLGITVSSADYGKTKPRTIFEKLPYRAMPLNLSRADGNLYFEPQEIKYIFAVKADTPEALAEKLSAVKAWVYSNGKNEILDGYRGGWRMTDVQCTGSWWKHLNIQLTHASFTATFQVNPYELSADGKERRLI